MKLHYKGAYDCNPESIPHKGHQPGAVPFKEAKSIKTLALIANGLCILLIILLAIPVVIQWQGHFNSLQILFGCAGSMLVLFPHELLHAVCFKEDVYLYTNWKQGMLFVVGPETMSKGRFIFMSLLPNIVFGFIPYLIGIAFPKLVIFSVFGTLSIGMGGGDYYNVWNALTQMPKGARTYLHQINSYWYIP